jgi:hypothetical protein
VAGCATERLGEVTFVVFQPAAAESGANILLMVRHVVIAIRSIAVYTAIVRSRFTISAEETLR